MLIVAILIGVAAGSLAAWLFLRERVVQTRRSLAGAESERDEKARLLGEREGELARVTAELQYEKRAFDEKRELLGAAQAELGNAFKALSAEALRQNSSSFLQLARTQLEGFQVGARDDLDQRRKAVEQLVGPLKDQLDRVGREVQTLEQARREAYGTLTAQVRLLGETQERLRTETGHLVTALRAPSVRGRWGEMQLRRAVETAGMLAYCDFVEQPTAAGDERQLRPDLIVKLPGNKNVVVDAKAPLQALLDALDAPDEPTRAACLQDYARHVREHVARLSAKAYWQQFSPTPDFVVMFLPGESFFRAALEQDPALLEHTVNERVILASPTTLITLLRSVAVGWREETVAESARAVSELGRELYDRLTTLTEHFMRLGSRLDGAVQEYNKTVASLERRVLVSARRFTEHGVGSKRELPSPSPVESSTQPPQTIELGAHVHPEPAGELTAVADPAKGAAA